jgi:hypothetical protein
MITFHPILKETLCYLLGPSWVPAEKVGMTARPKESEDFSLETRNEATSDLGNPSLYRMPNRKAQQCGYLT